MRSSSVIQSFNVARVKLLFQVSVGSWHGLLNLLAAGSDDVTLADRKSVV